VTDENQGDVLLASAEDTAALGAAVARALAGRAGAVVHLEGPLGAGKTTLARGLLRALGVTGTIRSPTYTLLEPYEPGGRTVIHLDLYRLTDPRELEPLGLRDYPPERCWWLVEWPERGGGRLPPPDLRLLLAHDPHGRRATLAGPTAPDVRKAYERVV
jgi:tRNA threonylcarbamoyladenosine biosynthesis protein TsaE